MQLSLQKQARILIPGGLLLFTGIVLFRFLTDTTSKLSESTEWIFGGGLVFCYFFGALYELYQLRAVINGQSHKRITQHICRTLLNLGRTRPLNRKARDELLKGRQLLSIFYHLVDRDPSLSQKSRRIRWNGLLWTSAADFALIGYLSAVVYALLGLVLPDFELVLGGIGALVVGVIFHKPILTRAEKRHIELSTEQLDHIALHYSHDLRKKVDQL